MAIFTVRDLKIHEVREYMDTLYASHVFAGAREETLR
jgi:ketosteroid isomerase-like protein